MPGKKRRGKTTGKVEIMKKKTPYEIYVEMEDLIPQKLWEKFNHLSFGEMAAEPELSDWRDELREAENSWWKAEKKKSKR